MNAISRRRFNLITLASGLTTGSFRTAEAAEKKTSVVLLLSGSVADGGWGQLAYGGIKALQSNTNFKATFAENISQAQIQQVVRGYADDAYSLIIGHGYEFGGPLLEIAPDYPKTKFFVSSFLPQPKVPANILYADLAYFDAAYAAGSLAAMMSKKKKAVGFVGGGDNPTQQNMLKAFIAGAEKSVPGIKGLGIVTGDYNNAAKGKQAAATMIGNGADVIWHAADVTGLGAMQAAVEANVMVIGCYADQTSVAPKNIGTSFELNLSGMVGTVAKDVASGKFKGGIEWQPSLSEMWVLKAGSHGDHNPQVIDESTWKKFKGVWSDIATRKINVTALLK